MIRQIRIEGLGVIDEAVLDLSDGLNVLTGETGAGKTMVVQSLALLLGGRADPALVRSGSTRAAVEGVADLPDGHPALQRAEEAGADVSDELIIGRLVPADGRSRAVVGGRTTPAGVLVDIGQQLVAVHGQTDQWRLQRLDQHRVMLDDFGGEALAEAASTYRSTYQQWRATRAELTDLTDQARARAQRLDQLTAALQEIERIDPTPGEDEALRDEAAKLQHVDALREAVAAAHDLLVGTEDVDGAPQVLEPLTAARTQLDGAAALDPSLAELATRLRELSVLVADAGADLASYLADLDVEPGRLEAVMQRRAELGGLARKYGDSVEEVLAWSEKAAVEVEGLAGDDERIDHLREQLQKLDERVRRDAGRLTELRQDAADRLGIAVTEELGHLAMGSARVEVAVRSGQGRLGPDGQDEVEILMAANKGAALRNVAKAASGGELSRLMLALEVVTASGDVPTFVFDEVDAGVGGSAALDIGSRLKALSRHSQVIVVTHLAQVAAYADRHLVVHKAESGEVTSSDVRIVEGQDRVGEIARMLAGDRDSATARAHAADLLERVQAAAS